MNGEQNAQEFVQYMTQQPQRQMFPSAPDDMMMQFGGQVGHSGQMLDPNVHGISHAQAHHNLPPNHYNLYEGVENQIPDHMLEDADASENGPRRKKGSNVSQANENELRSTLRQYEHFSLKQMSTEVQKQEGSGGKSSEKVKQVFAMLW